MVGMCRMNQLFLTTVFRISSLKLSEVAFRHPIRVDWDVYKEELDGKLAACSGRMGTTRDWDRRTI